MGTPLGSTHPSEAEITEQTTRAYDLRLQGKTYREIAAELELSKDTVYKRLATPVARGPVADVEKYRALCIDRAEMAFAEAWKIVQSTTAPAVVRLKAIENAARRNAEIWEFSGNKTQSVEVTHTAKLDQRTVELLAKIQEVRDQSAAKPNDKYSRTIDGSVLPD